MSVKGSLQVIPKPRYGLTLSFNCNREKQQKLMQIVYKELDDLISKAVIASDLEDIKKAILKNRKESDQDQFVLGKYHL